MVLIGKRIFGISVSRFVVAALLLCINPCDDAYGSIILTDVTKETGITFKHTDGSSGQRYIVESVSSGLALFDYDGDGEKELIIDELLGLVGTEVTVEGHMQSDNWMSVFTINGQVYREPGQPIWASQHQWRWRHRK